MLNNQMDHPLIFEQVFDLSPIGIAFSSPEGKLLKVNAAFCDMLGYTREECDQLPYQSVTAPEDVGMCETHLQALLSGACQRSQYEKRFLRKNGELLWALVHVTLSREPSTGEPLYFVAHVVDISAKKASEAQLLDIQEKFQLISEHARDIIYVSSPDGTCQYITPSVRSLLGYEPEDVIGSNNIEYYHPDDLRELKQQQFKDEDVMRYRLFHKDGHYVWFETTFKLIRDEQGNVEKVLAIGRDITERKRNEDILAEAQRITSLGSWEYDIGRKQLAVSEQMYEIYSVDKSAFNSDLQSIAGHLIHPDDLPEFMQHIDHVLQGHPLSYEFRNIQPDGTIKHLHIRGSVTLDHLNKPVKINGTVQDITDRKLIEQKLKETVERYTSLKKFNHDGIFSLDLEGNIINANSAAEKLTGLKAAQMSGTNIARFISDDILNRMVADPVQSDVTEHLRHIDGRVFEVLLTIAPIIINNQTVGYYIIIKDITEQRKLLVAKEAAENTNRAKTEFLSMMSHEIRTPMNGVIGMADLLMQTTTLDETQLEYVELIRKSGNTLLTIINDILDFSKIEAGSTTLREEPFDVRDTVAETLDLLSQSAVRKQLHTSYMVHSAVPRVLIGDPDRLKQVLINLIGNAIKFTPSGSIAVSVEVNALRENAAELQFKVKDTGIGIPADKQELIFDPFSQLDHFMTRKSEGTGLGLAISKRLVELMGGTIRVESGGDEPGSTFIFTVRLARPEPASAHAAASLTAVDKPTIGSLSLLVAEDNEINQLVLRKMLESLGNDVTIVGDGRQAVQAVQQHRYDMVFMDIQMPVLDGLEAMKQIRQTLPAEACPIIVAVTANALNGEREKCLAAGMDDYIAKPLKIESITEVIQRFFLRAAQ